MCLEAVKLNGELLGEIDTKFRTPAVCLAAVQRSGMAIEYVPKKLLTKEMCIETVKNNPKVIFAPPIISLLP
jgi:hypothetical protein